MPTVTPRCSITIHSPHSQSIQINAIFVCNTSERALSTSTLQVLGLICDVVSLMSHTNGVAIWWQPQAAFVLRDFGAYLVSLQSKMLIAQSLSFQRSAWKVLLEWGTTSHRFPGLTGQFWGRSQQLDSLAWTGVPVAPEFLENLSFNLDMPGFLLACITELLGHPFKVWKFDRLEDNEKAPSSSSRESKSRKSALSGDEAQQFHSCSFWLCKAVKLELLVDMLVIDDVKQICQSSSPHSLSECEVLPGSLSSLLNKQIRIS